MCDQEPCLGALDGFLPVLGEAAAPPEPGEGAFDHPTAGQHLEALRGVGALDDFHGPAPDFLQRALELLSGIAAIGENVAKPGV